MYVHGYMRARLGMGVVEVTKPPKVIQRLEGGGWWR